MISKRRSWVWMSGLPAVFAAAALILAPQVSSKTAGDLLYEQVELLAEAITIIQSDYVDLVEPKRLIYGALKGLVESLDRHSQFLDPDAYSEMQVETKGEFGGLGLEITVAKDGMLTIVTPMDNTPAAAAGLKAQDKIAKIDDQSTRGISLHEAVKRLRGKPGTRVVLTILREKENELFDVTLSRTVVKIHSVKEAKFVAPQIGFIRITEFQDHTPRDMKKALETLEAQKVDGLILDLRNNPGGLLDVAVEVSELFLPKGKMIVYTKGRIESQNIEFISKNSHPHLDYPMVVLVNEGSASAAEIVAGALRDHRRAILMGAKTFGKGSVQTVIPLKDNSAIRLTTSIYYTPSGQSIHGNGLEPDVEVKEDELSSEKERRSQEPSADFEDKEEGDPAVIRAVDLIRGLKAYTHQPNEALTIEKKP